MVTADTGGWEGGKVLKKRCKQTICASVIQSGTASELTVEKKENFKFLSDHSLLVADGRQPAPDQTMLDSHSGVSHDGERNSMTATFKYKKLACPI